MHNVPYAGHPRHQKTIASIKKQFFCHVMKREVIDYIARCLEFQRVKVEHRHPANFLKPFAIPKWKWEVEKIDFITKLPRTTKQHDSIMVVVDKLIKISHFIPVKLTHKEDNIVDIYMREIVRIHGVPKAIVSDRDPKLR
jgi:hypothetical protein